MFKRSKYLKITGLVTSFILPFASFSQAAEPDVDKSIKTYGSWTLECVTLNKNKDCSISQLIQKQDKESSKTMDVLRVSLGKLGNNQLGIIIGAPIGVALLPGVGVKLVESEKNKAEKPLQVVDEKGKRLDIPGLNYERCVPSSCFAAFPVDQIEIDRLKKGKELKVTISPSMNPKDNLVLDVSLKGFSDAFDAMVKNK